MAYPFQISKAPVTNQEFATATRSRAGCNVFQTVSACKHYAKDNERNEFADKVVTKVLTNQQMFQSVELVFYYTYKQVVATKWWNASESCVIFLGHNFITMTQPVRKCVWDGRLELRSVGFAEALADPGDVRERVATKVPFCAN